MNKKKAFNEILNRLNLSAQGAELKTFHLLLFLLSEPVFRLIRKYSVKQKYLSGL